MLVRMVATVVLVGFASVPTPSSACTTFLLPGDTIVGKSYDWHVGEGMVVVNKRNVKKTALTTGLFDKKASWTSRFGSVTFNQYGREFPNGGMNEAGLVIEIMWLNESVYPTRDKRAVISELQWIQYQLDNYATAKEVIANARALRVSPISAKVHYLACDRTGSCAAFEYINGKMTVSSGKDVRVLTNHTYVASKEYRSQHKGFGGKRSPTKSASSLDRFVRASFASQSKAKGNEVERAFAVLDSVSQGDYSKWNIVYDVKNLRVHFRSLGHRSKKVVDLKAFEFSCTTPSMVMELNSDFAGSVNKKFRPYSQKANKSLLTRSTAKLEPPVPATLVAIAAAYPSTTTCSDRGQTKK